MHRTMMDPAQWYGEFIAGLAAECARLQITKMMRVRRPATTDQAWLLGDRAKVLPVTITPWCGNSEGALVDARRLSWVCGFGSHALVSRST